MTSAHRMQGFPWTLQAYIFREMGKTFLLTAVALTAILGLGGGVMQMVELGEVTPSQLLDIVAMIVPVAGALTLPIAALFGAAATYGRLSADNEFVACRSSGINLHVLFLAPLTLSLLSAALTFLLINFLIPGMVRNLNEFKSADLGVLVQQRLSRPRGIALGRARVFAEDSTVNTAGDEIQLNRVTLVEMDQGEWARYGTAGKVHLSLDQEGRSVRVYGWMEDVSLYDRRDGRFTDLARQDIPANELPSIVPQEVKFLTLLELFSFYNAPGEWGEVAEAVQNLRVAVGRAMLWDDLWKEWTAGDAKTIVLSDVAERVVIHAERAGLLTEDDGIQLEGVSIDEFRDGRLRTRYTAGRAIVEIARGATLAETGVRVDAFDVVATSGEATLSRSRHQIGAIALPEALLQRVDAIPDAELLSGTAVVVSPASPVDRQREEAVAIAGETVRRIAATISERSAFSVSVFVLVLLGAALGIVFRGSQAIVAFGISFVPSLLVIVTIVMGKQMAINETTHLAGIGLMWGGILVVAILDLWVLCRVLRR